MATYKVIQDIEAEDKIIGPLTLREFIYAGASVLLFYFSYLLVAHHAGFMDFIFVPMALISGFFAWPWGRDQPTEIWALAKIRFYFKPRRRIWDQSGVKELVTVTVPKKLSLNYTNGLSQTEVKSRLKVLADTIDSRGWAIKNVNGTLYSQPKIIVAGPGSDRLINIDDLPKEVPTVDIRDSDDILDNRNSPIARQFDEMITASVKAHRQKIISHLRNDDQQAGASPPDSQAKSGSWFLNQPSVSSSQDAVTFNAQVVAPGSSVASLPVAPAKPTQDEEELIKQLEEQNKNTANAYSHLHTILPLEEQARQAKKQQQGQPKIPKQQVTRPRDAGILDLARNDDFNVATIAREAQKRAETSQNEVVISLH